MAPGDPARRYREKMGAQCDLPPATLVALIEAARKQGIDTSSLTD
jgi:hypothetical protein